MSLPRPGYEEQVARQQRTERAARRDFWRDMGRTALHLALSVGTGMGFIGWSWHSRDQVLAPILYLAGQGIWLCGVLWSLVAAYRRGHARGDW